MNVGAGPRARPYAHPDARLPNAVIAALAKLSEREGVSRAELIRRAVARYLAEHPVDEVDAFGLWAGRYPDALAYENELRGERDAEHAAPRSRRRRSRRR